MTDTPAELARDAEASADWARQYEDAYPRVFRALRGMGATTPEAEDAVQDAIETALRQKTSIQKLDGWLFVAASRRWWRMRWRQRLFRSLRGMVAFQATAGDQDLRLAVFDELRRLPRIQQEVVVARYIVGLSQEETARALGIPRGTVGAYVTKASRTIRARLKE